jgi:hypothetical protein
MNSSTRSCAVIAPAVHSSGKSMPVEALTSATWNSLNTVRPHWFAGAVPTGVLKV